MPVPTYGSGHSFLTETSNVLLTVSCHDQIFEQFLMVYLRVQFKVQTFLFFYINDLPSCLDFGKILFYVNDTSLTFSHTGICKDQIYNDLEQVVGWLSAYKLTLNFLESYFLLICSRQRASTIEGDISRSVNGI